MGPMQKRPRGSQGDTPKSKVSHRLSGISDQSKNDHHDSVCLHGVSGDRNYSTRTESHFCDADELPESRESDHGHNETFVYSLLSSQRKEVLFREFEILYSRKVANISDTRVDIAIY